MAPRKMKDFLDSTAGDEEIEFIIPHTFLPPRYVKEGERRNLIVMLDRDLTVHLRWENSRLGNWANITPGEFRRLMRECLNKESKYRADLKVFADFVGERAEAPFEDPIYDEPLALPSSYDKALREEGNKNKETVIYLNQDEDVGGEPPLLSMEW